MCSGNLVHMQLQDSVGGGGGGGGGDSRLATRLYSDFTLGDGYLIYWFPDPSQTNFTGSGGR